MILCLSVLLTFLYDLLTIRIINKLLNIILTTETLFCVAGMSILNRFRKGTVGKIHYYFF